MFFSVFTGIVETTAQVMSKESLGESIRLVVDAGSVGKGVKVGDSIANNGCCLTVVGIDGMKLSFDLLRETEEKTNLHALQTGSVVNLERSLRADSRLGGHFVTGHIDATGTIRKFHQVRKDYELIISFPKKYGVYLVPKGCIAIDGMSLTVVDVHPDTFSVWIIPHTLEVTCLKDRKIGDLVNLEFDLLAKYTEKNLKSEKSKSPKGGVTQKLKKRNLAGIKSKKRKIRKGSGE